MQIPMSPQVRADCSHTAAPVPGALLMPLLTGQLRAPDHYCQCSGPQNLHYPLQWAITMRPCAWVQGLLRDPLQSCPSCSLYRKWGITSKDPKD